MPGPIPHDQASPELSVRNVTGASEGRLGERVLNLVLVVMVVSAIITTGGLVRRWTVSEPRDVDMRQAVLLPNWTELLPGGHSEGPEEAPVVFIVFSDFQCPACRAFASTMRLLRADYPDSLRIVYRHFPLGSFAHSTDAALASECAAEQGRFRGFHDALFSDQEMIGQVPRGYFAARAGIPDREAFANCLSNANESWVSEDRRLGESIGVDSTPTWILNGRMMVGTPPLGSLREKVMEQLRQGED